MPALIPIVLGAVAAIGALGSGFAAGAAGFILGAGASAAAIASTAAIVAGTIGALVTTATSMLMTSLTSKPKKAATAAAQSSSALAQQASDQKVMVRSTVEAHRVVYGRARVSGPIIYSCSSGPDLRYLHLVICLAGHPIAAVDEVWLDDQVIPMGALSGNTVVTGKYANRVLIFAYLGDQTAASGFLMAESPDGWAATDILQGIAYLHIRFEYDRDVFTGGLPNVSAVVRGKKDILDPRTGASGYTDNWALCVLDYLRAEFGMQCASDQIDTASFVAAANLSDEAVPTGPGGAAPETRYSVNGSFKLDEQPGDIIEKLVGAGAGALTYSAGTYRLFGGAYASPAISLGLSDFAGDIEVVTRPPASETFNCIRGTFIDPGRQWQATEFPPLRFTADIAEDGGAEQWKDLELPFVTGGARAQRLATQLYNRTRAPMTFRAPLKYGSGLRLAAWDVVAVTQPDLGWAAKPFRLTQWNFDPASAAITVEMQEELPSAYAWSWDLAQPTPDVPRTTLANALSRPVPPAGLGFAEGLYATRDGAGVRTQLTLTWAPVPNIFVRDYEVQYRSVAEAAWRPAPPSDATSAVIADLAAGTYLVQVRARTGYASSDWATLTATIGGLAALPPADITGLAVQSIGGLAFLRWDQHPDIDVRAGGQIEFRHTPETAAPAWVGATGIGDAIPGAATTAILPLKPGTYLAKAIDAGGRYGANAATVQAVQATALAFANVASLTEHPGFAGTRTGTVVLSASLRLDSGGLIDAEPSWDAIPDLDSMGGVLASGSYQFSGGMDLTTVQRVRLTPRLLALVVNTLDQVDSRTAPVDAWSDWDGAVGGEADAWVEVRETPDNPGGSPTWSAWKRLDQGEFQNRAFQFRVQLRSTDPAFNIHITELSVAADKV